MEIFREDLGMSTLVGRYDSDRDLVTCDVEDRKGKITHAGDSTCNLIDVIQCCFDDYTALDAHRLAIVINGRVISNLVALDAPDQESIWEAERDGLAREDAEERRAS